MSVEGKRLDSFMRPAASIEQSGAVHSGRGMGVVDEHACFVRVDDDLAGLLGYQATDLIGVSGFRFVHPDDLDLCRELLENLVSGELSETTVDVRLLRRDGQFVDLSAKALVLPQHDDSKLQLLVSFHSEKPLRALIGESNDRFRRLVETAQAIPFEYELGNHCYSYVGQQAVAMLGYPEESWYEPRFWFRITHDDDRDAAETAFDELTARGQQIDLTYRVRNAAGEIVWLREVAQADLTPGKPAHYWGFLFNVTEARRTELALRENEQQLRRLTETSPDLIASLDAAGHFTYASGSYRHILGYEPGSLLSHNAFELVHDDDQPEVRAAFDRHLTERSRGFARFRFRHADGHYVWMESTANVLLDDAGEIKGTVITSRDISRQVQVEEELRGSRERFRQLVESTGIVAYESDPISGEISYVGPQIEALLGFPVQNWYSHEFWGQRIHPDDKDIVERLRLESAPRGEHTSATFRLLAADGREVWVRDLYFPELTDGRLTRIRGFLMDITEEKHIELEMLNSRERFRLLVESTGVAAYEFDAQSGEIIYVAPQFETLLGFPVENWYNKRFWRAAVHPDDLEETDELLRNISEGDSANSVTYRMRNSQGRFVWVKDVFYLQVVEGRLGRIRGFLIDVDAEKNVEAELLASRERFRLLIESTGIVAYESDRHTSNVTYIGPQIVQLLGYPLEHWYEESFWLTCIHPEDRDQALQSLEEIRALGQPAQLVYRMLDAHGRVVWVRDHYHPIYREGQLVGDRGFIIDITQEKRAEQERILMEEQIQQAQRMESLGQMAGGIAHDFNNLLTAIGGYADLAARETAESETRQLIEQIVSATRRASDLTRQLLAYSGQGRRVQQPCNVNNIVREMSALLQSVISRKASLRFELAEEDMIINGEASQLRQVVMELLSNASDSIGDNPGEIVVRTARERVGKLSSAASFSDGPPPPGSFVTLEVEDTGCGMDSQSMRRIFDPFFTTKFTGRGLGLAAVKGIVRGHGGTVQVESRPGLGTCMKIYLPSRVEEPVIERPLPPVPAQVAERPLPSQAAPLPELQVDGYVLVVDDEESVRAITKAILQKQGLQVLTAADGVEAVDIIASRGEEIGLVLLDVTMPRMGGVEAFRRMRELKPDLRVVLSSGYNQTEAYRQFNEQGLFGFIQKPYLRQELLGTLSALLNQAVSAAAPG